MKSWAESVRKLGFLLLSLAVGLILWQLFTTYSEIPSFIFPKPVEVWTRLITVIKKRLPALPYPGHAAGSDRGLGPWVNGCDHHRLFFG